MYIYVCIYIYIHKLRLCCALVYIRILSIRYAIRPKAAVF